MATKLYDSGFQPSDALKQDTKALLRCPKESIEKLLEAIADESRLVQNLSEKSTARIARNFGVPGITVRSALSLARFFIGVHKDYGDDLVNLAEEVAQDLQIDESGKDRLTCFAKSLAKNAIEAEGREGARYATAKTIPLVRQLSYVCDLRVVADHGDFDPWYEPLRNYRPVYKGLMPVAIFRIRLDAGVRANEIVFQAAETDLESIITILEQAATDIKGLRDKQVPLNILPPLTGDSGGQQGAL